MEVIKLLDWQIKLVNDYNQNCNGMFRVVVSDGKGVTIKNVFDGSLRTFEYNDWNAMKIWKEVDRLCGHSEYI